MDLDGVWNPPETWPEAEPPLPGWIRSEDGQWQAAEVPDDEATDQDHVEDQAVRTRPRITVASAESVGAGAPPLPFGPPLRQAAMSALIAGVAALAVALIAIAVVTFL